MVHTHTQMMVMSTIQTTLWRYSFGTQPGRSSAGPRASTGPVSATGDSADSGARGRQSRATGQQAQHAQETPIKVMQWNAEGIRNKKPELQEFLRMNKVDVLCAQETHLSENHRFFVRGYELFRADRSQGPKGGVLTLVKNNIPAVEVYRTEQSDIELISVKLLLQDGELTVTNCYCPPNKQLQLHTIPDLTTNHVIVGDFNGHSPSWGYPEFNSRGQEIEDWMVDNQLILVNQPDDPPTCYSRAWKSSSTPDIAVATGDVHRLTTRAVCQQLGGSDHRPVVLTINCKGSYDVPRKEPSWNYKKANWEAYRDSAEQKCHALIFTDNIDRNTTSLNEAILASAKTSIPRGCRKNYKAYWSPEVDQLHKDLTTARDNMESNPSAENIKIHNDAKEEFNSVKNKEIQKSWHEKTSKLNLEKDTTQLWKLTRSLDEDYTQAYAKIAVEDGGNWHTGRMAANVLADAFEEVSKLEMPTERVKEANVNTRASLQEHAPQECMTKDFTILELNAAIRKLKTKKAPGKDGITNEMILHLGPLAKQKLLSLFNQSWKSGKVPNQWKEAVIIPIPKKGKDKKDKNNYRPISLLSCLGKLLERLVNSRLMNYLETNQLICQCQTGYRKNRSTEDQLVYIAQEIENAFQEKKKVLTVFVDLKKAFDKVWKKGLLQKLAEKGINGSMFYWIKNFLSQRTARVKVDGKTSHLVKLQEGVPQGGVISPILFLVFINDIMEKVPERISRALHADDLAAWYASEHISTATLRMQDALNQISKWSEDWGVEINTRKTVATCFSLAKKPEKFSLYMNGKELPQDDTPTYLGATFDRTLTWNMQIQKAEKRATLRLSLMKKLAGTTWGANSKILKTVYTGTVRPAMEYGMSAWATATKTNSSRLDKVQNTGLRIITGAMKTTPIVEMEKLTGLHSMSERREEKVLTHSERLKRLPVHPAHARITEPTKNRLKRQSFNHISKALGKKHGEGICAMQAERELLKDTTNSDVHIAGVQISTDIPGIQKKEDFEPYQLKALTQEYLEKEFKASQWIHVYTDGSAESGVQNGGSGVYIRFPEGRTISRSCSSGRFSTNFRAEQTALLAAATLMLSEKPDKPVVFLTDCRSVLESLQTPAKDDNTSNLQETLSNLSQVCTIALQWIPSHCQIFGNEKADSLSKAGSKMEQYQHPVSYPEAKTLIKNSFHQQWKHAHGCDEVSSLDGLERWEQTIIFRLRTGHCRLLSHMYRLKIAHSDECTCGTGVQTPEHVLQDCPLFSVERKNTWPHGGDLQGKLWGSTTNLKATACFIKETKLNI